MILHNMAINLLKSRISNTQLLFSYFKSSFAQNKLSINNFSIKSRSNMRFLQFVPSNENCSHIGVQLSKDSDIVDLNAVDCSIPTSMIEFIECGFSIEDIKRKINNAPLIPLSSIKILAPVSRPDKVIGVGLNYHGHCAEQNKPPPTEPMFFSKFSSVIIGPTDNIEHPSISQEVDWEVELAIIIGKKGKNISKENAYEYVFGYTVANDISARDWQKKRNNGQFLLGKSMDTFCPLGPVILHKSEVENSQNLSLKCWVNGVLKQSGNTNDTVFSFDDCISRLSQCFTLYPGDVILTGTPAGVGLHQKPPQFLKPGDILETEIDIIGKLKNKIV